MAKGKHNQPSLVPQFDPKRIQTTTYLNKSVAFKTITQTGNDQKVVVSLRLIQEDFQCFSEWSRQEMKAFWDFNRQIHDYSWQDVLVQGGKAGSKVGFGYTEISRDQYPNPQFKGTISPDIQFFELRVNQTIRVHGFRDGQIFYICWLDKNHALT